MAQQYPYRVLFAIILFILFIHALIPIAFAERLVPVEFIISSLVTPLLYFTGLKFIYQSWQPLANRSFIINLFMLSILLRLAATILLYYYYLYTTSEPFEVHAVDSIFYHETGMEVASQFRVYNFNTDSYLRDLPFSDRGYNLYLGFIYSIFGDHILIPRIINTLFSSLSVLLVYRVAKTHFGEQPGRLAGIMAMLLPNFMLYQGTHMKETVMLFLVSATLYTGVQLVHAGKRNLLNIALLIGLFFLLFMFRTVLAAIMICSFFLYAFLYKPSTNRIFNIATSFFLIACFTLLVMNSQMGNEVSEYVERSENSLNNNLQFRADREGGNKYALLAGAPLLLSLVIMAPFPSWVHVPLQDFLWMFAGANLIRNMYAFFAIAAIIKLSFHRWRSILFLVGFAGGYFLILAQSGLALSERFQLPAVPAIIILSAYGIHSVTRKDIRLFEYYLMFLTLLIVAWNYIKIHGRM